MIDCECAGRSAGRHHRITRKAEAVQLTLGKGVVCMLQVWPHRVQRLTYSYPCQQLLDHSYACCRGLYHCNYCQKDITGVVRIKCAVCPDFDLCLDCFSVGVEISPHQSDHAYRVMDCLSFPLFHPDWGVRHFCLPTELLFMLRDHVAKSSQILVMNAMQQCLEA